MPPLGDRQRGPGRAVVIGAAALPAPVYLDRDGVARFETANEVRVPVGRPVELVLRSADVVHSFWVPLLAGKTDLIPGQENRAWLPGDLAPFREMPRTSRGMTGSCHWALA